MPTPWPHDALFKSAFAAPEHAGPLLKDAMPSDLAALLDWDTLTLEAGSYIRPDLAASASDLLFSLRLRSAESSVFVYTLVEHQSELDRWMPLRMLEYMLRI